MPGNPLYLDDCYLKEWEAEVVKADKKFIVLDRTAFYPNSGGQPWDEGEMVRTDGNLFRIVFVGKFGGDISHEVDREGLNAGDKVKCRINWDRRYTFMRYHTAAHIISAVVNKETGAMITGNQIGLDKTRFDFSLDNFDRELIQGYEQKANEIIKKNLPVSTKFLPRDEVMNDPDLVKLAKGMPDSIQTFRIVDVEGFDRQACGGTHVRNTKEIGTLKILNLENKGKNNRRMYFKLE